MWGGSGGEERGVWRCLGTCVVGVVTHRHSEAALGAGRTLTEPYVVLPCSRHHLEEEEEEGRQSDTANMHRYTACDDIYTQLTF